MFSNFLKNQNFCVGADGAPAVRIRPSAPVRLFKPTLLRFFRAFSFSQLKTQFFSLPNPKTFFLNPFLLLLFLLHSFSLLLLPFSSPKPEFLFSQADQRTISRKTRISPDFLETFAIYNEV